jgi:hypothetical protein
MLNPHVSQELRSKSGAFLAQSDPILFVAANRSFSRLCGFNLSAFCASWPSRKEEAQVSAQERSMAQFGLSLQKVKGEQTDITSVMMIEDFLGLARQEHIVYYR